MSVKPSIIISNEYGKTIRLGLSRTSDVMLNDDGHSNNAKQRLMVRARLWNLYECD